MLRFIIIIKRRSCKVSLSSASPVTCVKMAREEDRSGRSTTGKRSGRRALPFSRDEPEARARVGTWRESNTWASTTDRFNAMTGQQICKSTLPCRASREEKRAEKEATVTRSRAEFVSWVEDGQKNGITFEALAAQYRAQGHVCKGKSSLSTRYHRYKNSERVKEWRRQAKEEKRRIADLVARGTPVENSCGGDVGDVSVGSMKAGVGSMSAGGLGCTVEAAVTESGSGSPCFAVEVVGGGGVLED